MKDKLQKEILAITANYEGRAAAWFWTHLTILHIITGLPAQGSLIPTHREGSAEWKRSVQFHSFLISSAKNCFSLTSSARGYSFVTFSKGTNKGFWLVMYVLNKVMEFFLEFFNKVSYLQWKLLHQLLIELIKTHICVNLDIFAWFLILYCEPDHWSATLVVWVSRLTDRYHSLKYSVITPTTVTAEVY